MRSWHFSNFYFFYFTTVGIIIPYWGLFLQHRGFNATEIGQLMAILMMTKVLASNVWAAVADNFAAKHGGSLGIIRFVTFAALLVFSGLNFAHSFWAVALLMFGYCIFWDACLPQIEAATLNHLQDNRDKYGLIRLWGSIGFIVTVLAVGWLMDLTNPAVVLPAGGFALFALFIVSFLMRDSGQKRSDESSVKVPIMQLLNRKVVLLLLLCTLMQLSHAPFYTFFSIYLEGYGYSKLHIGWLWSTGVIFEIGIFIIGYRLLRRFRLSHLLSFTFFIAAVRWYLVATYPQYPLIIFVSQIMHAFTYGLYHSVMIQFIDRLFKGRYQIRGQALYSSVTYGLGGVIGSFASGYVWTEFGRNVLFMGASAVMIVVCVVSLLFASRITAQVTP